MLRFLAPHLRLQSVCQLSLDRLRSLGLDALLLDVDCTLKRYTADGPAADVAAWLEELRAADVGLCLVSNGLGKRVGRFAKKLDLPFVAKALKPLPFRCRAAMRKMNFEPSRTAMVGDQLFADVMAGRLAGLTSILVRPIHPEEERWFTRIKRGPERCLLRWMNVEEEPAVGDCRGDLIRMGTRAAHTVPRVPRAACPPLFPHGRPRCKGGQAAHGTR